MARRYFVDELPAPGAAVLTGDTAHHLLAVLRSQPGDAIVLADGRGNECRAVVQHCGKRDIAVQAEPAVAVPRSPFRLHLAVALPKGTRAEWLFEHGTEVGVDVFWPLWTERSRPIADRADRWHKLVRAAAGQCDRAWLPEVREPAELAAFFRAPELPAQRFVGAAGAEPAPAVLRGDAVLLVGPEGGLAQDEQAAATAAGFRPIGLGPHVLRTETAAVVGAAALVLAAARTG